MTTAEVLFLILTFVIHGAVIYRVGRFIALDTLVDEPRDWLIATLESVVREPDVGRWSRLWRRKLLQLIECPWCVCVHVSAATVAIHHFFIFSLPYPIFWWLATNTVALVFWDRVEPD